jgi:hypothetical protein
VVGSGVRLKPLAYDTPLSSTTYLIECRNLIVQQNSISISVQWIDGANILQNSATSYTLSLPAAGPILGSLISKSFNTLGYDSQLTFSLALATNLNDQVDVWMDVGSNRIHNMVL